MSHGAPDTVNFVAELGDLKHITSLASLKTDPRIRQRLARRASQTARYLANAHLTWSFGVKPFMSDVQKLIDELSGWKVRFDKLVADAGKLQRHHYRKSLANALPANSSTYYGSWEHATITYNWVKSPLYTATACYRYGVDTGPLAQVAAFLDAFGVRLNPQILWNHIPFTFVVDWFVGVGDWLSQYSADNLGVQVELIDFCHSVKFAQSAILQRSFGRGPLIPMWSADVHSYIRKRAIPVMFKSVGSGSGFGAQQGALSASLLAQRLL
jgi:hypothetical protein